MATAYMDWLIDEDTGDLAIINGDFALTPDSTTSLRQRLTLRFGTWKEEWVYNTVFGTPYRQRLFTGGFTKGQADAEFIAQINLEEDVTAVKNVISTFNPITRSYELTRIEAYVDNVLVDLSLAAPQFTRYAYPEPVIPTSENFNVCELDQEFIDNSNLLYEFLNIDLPETGSSTWWNTWVGDAIYVNPDYVDINYVIS
jgi:hypothetical protein